MRKTGFTLIEVLVTAAIFATLVGLMMSVALPGGREKGQEPPSTIHLWTVKHDDHWWIKSTQHFAHHPDCPCQSVKAELY